MADTLKVTNLSSMKIGIGSTQPAYALDVVGSINLTGHILTNGSSPCSLCRYATMIRETISDVPLPPVGADRSAIDRFATSAVAIAQAKRLSFRTPTR
jgi:hypothetical protein